MFGEKTGLTKALLMERLGESSFNQLPNFNHPELFEYMVENLYAEVQKSSYEEIKARWIKDPKITELEEIFVAQYYNEKNFMTPINFRLHPTYVDLLYMMKQKKIREVVEMAIAFFIMSKVNKEHFELIKLSLKYQELNTE